jgi:hypothetical protein
VEISVITKRSYSIRLIFGKEEIEDIMDLYLNRLNICFLIAYKIK